MTQGRLEVEPEKTARTRAEMPRFEICYRDNGSAARTGRIRTAHGFFPTPAFLPTATLGAVKTLAPEWIPRTGTEALLCNAFHLALRPGDDLIRDMGGLHRFMGWPGPILTDSGGFQIFSLARQVRLSDAGIRFQSPIDGSTQFFSPERVIEIQENLGSDLWMPLDHPVAYPESTPVARDALERTLTWAKRSFEQARNRPGWLFGIVQGSTYGELRRESVEKLRELGFTGFAIGGLALGEDAAMTLETVEATIEHVPEDSPRYLMGIGPPEQLLDSIARGVDLFDCVLPTRNGRDGWAYTRRGIVKIKHERYKKDPAPLDADCDCPACRSAPPFWRVKEQAYTEGSERAEGKRQGVEENQGAPKGRGSVSRAYLRHLFQSQEALGPTLFTVHNLTFFQDLMKHARQAIVDGGFRRFREAFMESYRPKEA